MYARVARFEERGATHFDVPLRRSNSQAASGPPEAVSAKGLLMVIDPESGRSLAVSLFETEQDLRMADETLNSMSPSSEDAGTRTSVETYEVAVDLRI